MTAMLANAGAMPARSPHLNLKTLESFRKLKSAFATPLPHSWSSSRSQQTTLFSGDGAPATTTIAAASRVRGDGGEEKITRRLHVFSSFGGQGAQGDEDEEERAGTRSKHSGTRYPHPELKGSWTRPRAEKADIESSRQTKWTRSPQGNSNRQNFSSRRAAFGTNVVARNNGGGGGRRRRRGELGIEGSSSSTRGISGFQGDVENDDLVREERRVAFEKWALEKFREAGTTALPAIEEMRQAFATGSPALGPHLVSSAVQPERNFVVQKNLQHRQTGGRSRFTGSPIADFRNSGRTVSANGGYGSSRVDRRGPLSSPTSRFGAGMSEQQLVARSSTRSESWSPRFSGTSPGSRSGSNIGSSAGVQFPAEESGKTIRDESTSGSKSGGESIPEPLFFPREQSPSAIKPAGQSIPEPLFVKRRTKFPINFHGRGGTVMLVDKPQGWTSFAVCAKLRYLLKIQKVGHAGTLDPMATGLLIVCLGKATKLADSFQAMTKVYSGTFRLGELTPSLDADTEVSDMLPWEHITDDQLEQAKQEFVGDIFQTPPMYSAIKVDGERLYVKARKGEQIEIPARLVTVNDFQLERSPENRQDIHFKVTCSKGTYIRSLCADLARAVGSYGHLTALRREKIGKHGVKDAWPILEFVEQYSQARDTVAIHAKT